MYNINFESSSRKITIPSTQIEESHAKAHVQEDRTHQQQACIIRIMKARGVINHRSLIDEVVKQLRDFSPDPRKLKQNIEDLIDKDYLEKEMKDNDWYYKYLA